MNWVSIIGGIAGCLALLGFIYTFAKYSVKINLLWAMKGDLDATVIKIDALWKIYIEDNLIRHSNPGGSIMLPDELKNEIQALLNNNQYFQQVKEPTLLVIDKLGIEKLAVIARSNKADLGQVLAEVNNYVFLCLRGS